MAQTPIETTITLQWDFLADCWRDKQTGGEVIGVQRWVSAAPSQSSEHPFDKSFAVTYEQVQKMIQDAIEQHSAKTNMYFQQDRSRLVTVGYLWEVVGNLSHEINVLERRLMVVDRPWWKRWFGR